MHTFNQWNDFDNNHWNIKAANSASQNLKVYKVHKSVYEV